MVTDAGVGGVSLSPYVYRIGSAALVTTYITSYQLLLHIINKQVMHTNF